MHYKLILIRKSKKFTQERISALIAMEQTTYSRKERGLSPISTEEWERIANVLEVKVEEITEDNYSVSNSMSNKKSIETQNIILIKESYEKIIQAKDEQIVLLKELLGKK